MCSGTSTSDRNCPVHLLLLCAIQLLLGVFYLGSAPRIDVDEVWDASLGYELAKTGVFRHPFIHNFGGMEVYFVQPRVVLPIICAGVFKVIGYSVAISRLPSLLMGVLAIIALYHIAGRFFGNKQSFFMCLAAIIYPWFWMDSRRCRPEIYYTALALVFLWLVISYFRRDRALTAFFAGVTAALASLSHPNGLIMVAAISISWIVWKEKPHLHKFVIWSLAGFVLTILPYVIYALWASKQPGVSFLEQVQFDILHGSVISKEMVRWNVFLQLPFGIPIALIIFASWLAAWWKSVAEDKFVATAVIIYILSLPFLSVNALADYLVVIIPFFSILVVRLIYRMNEFDHLNISRKINYIAGFAVIMIYVVSSLPPIIFIQYQQRNADFNHVVDKVAKVVGPKARVYANPVFWIGHDRYIYCPFLVKTDFGMTLQDFLQWSYSQSLEYTVRTAWAVTPPRAIQKPSYKMPEFRSDFSIDTLCIEVGTKVYEFYDEYYGPIEIYKLDWSRAWKWGLRKQNIK